MFANCALLFVVLFHVYPFKYLTLAIVGPPFGLPRLPMGDTWYLMLLYSGAIYQHAWRQRDALGLDAGARHTLRFSWRAQLISTSIAAVSIALVFVLPDRLMAIPGVLYGLMGPLHGWNGYLAGKASTT